MKMAVLHVNSSSPVSTSPTMRIAAFAADELRVPLICSGESAKQWVGTKFDVLFVKYGMLKFSNHREEALKIYADARRVVNLENDYLMVPDKRFRPADETWSTVEGKTRYVNWNIITRHGVDAWASRNQLPSPSKRGIIYYGAHRDGRIKKFVTYFKTRKYPVTVSSFRGGPKFKETCGWHVETLSAFRNPDDQAQWPLTIYMQDEHSDQQYTSPATRFYECVMAGLAQVVDYDAVPTLRKAGITVNESEIVASAADVARCLPIWKSLQSHQRTKWFVDFSKDLRKQFWTAYKHSFGASNGKDIKEIREAVRAGAAVRGSD